jgi:recombination protein RecA
VVDKSGAWFTYKKDRIGQGKDNSREYLKEHPELAAEIEAKIREKAGIANPALAPAPAVAAEA